MTELSSVTELLEVLSLTQQAVKIAEDALDQANKRLEETKLAIKDLIQTQSSTGEQEKCEDMTTATVTVVDVDDSSSDEEEYQCLVKINKHEVIEDLDDVSGESLGCDDEAEVNNNDPEFLPQFVDESRGVLLNTMDSCKSCGHIISSEDGCSTHLEEVARDVFGVEVQSLFFNHKHGASRDDLKLKSDEVWVLISRSRRILFEYPFTTLLKAVDYVSKRMSWRMKLMRFKDREIEMLKRGVLEKYIDHVTYHGKVYIKRVDGGSSYSFYL